MKYLFSLACLFFSYTLHSQVLTGTEEVVFGPTFETHADSQIITLYNLGQQPVEAVQHLILPTYGQPAFWISPTSFIVAPQDSQKITVYFLPRHNIFHESELIFQLNCNGDNEFYGNYRINLKGQGRYFKNYYSSTENLEEEDLKNALKSRIALGYASQGYSQRILMFSTFDNWKVNGRGSANDKVECVYTGRTIENYPMNTGSLVNSPWNFNTEHTFPQSFFNSAEPMRSDFFHLFTTDENINNTRGNLPYGIVSNPIGQNGGSKWNNTTFEPRDEHKGVVARAMMYFVLRYQDYNGFFAPQESVLRQWHFQFLPDPVEKKRCDDIASYQQNRNPFIDYPQFLERISKISGFSFATPFYQYQTLDTVVDFGNRTANQLWFYDMVIANSGNQDLTFSNINVIDPLVQIVSGGNDTTIVPGEALTVRLAVNTNQPINSHLNILVQPLGSNFTIPVKYLTNSTANQASHDKKYQIFPNPASDFLHINPHPQTVRLTDLYGKEFAITIENGKISVSELPNGLYILQIDERPNKVLIQK